MKTREQAKVLLESIKKKVENGDTIMLHPKEIEAVPKWIEWLENYIRDGTICEGGHNPVRLWIVEAPFSPINVFENTFLKNG